MHNGRILSCNFTESHLDDQVLNCALYCSPLKATELVGCVRHCASTEARRNEVIVLVVKELPKDRTMGVHLTAYGVKSMATEHLLNEGRQF